MVKSGRKRLLERPEIQAQILRNLELTGQENIAFKDVVSSSAYYDFKNTNKEFAQSVARANQRFREALWSERPDLKQLAIKGLEANLIPFVQTTTKIYYDIKIKYDVKNGKEVTTQKEIPVKKEVITWTKPPSKWAIEKVLGMDIKREAGFVDLSEIAELLKGFYTLDPRYEKGGEWHES